MFADLPRKRQVDEKNELKHRKRAGAGRKKSFFMRSAAQRNEIYEFVFLIHVANRPLKPRALS